MGLILSFGDFNYLLYKFSRKLSSFRIIFFPDSVKIKHYDYYMNPEMTRYQSHLLQFENS